MPNTKEEIKDALWELAAADSKKYYPPAGAIAACKKAIKWKEEKGSEVKGGTIVGWTRARQIASGKGVSADIVLRMSNFFTRHLKNKAIDPKYKDEPWKDHGYVAWLIWGGDAGATWSHAQADKIREERG